MASRPGVGLKPENAKNPQPDEKMTWEFDEVKISQGKNNIPGWC